MVLMNHGLLHGAKRQRSHDRMIEAVRLAENPAVALAFEWPLTNSDRCRSSDPQRHFASKSRSRWAPML